MKVLFIGGTGVISTACSTYALSKGIELYHLNRGNNPANGEIRNIKADIRNMESVRAALGDLEFDAVVDWIAFEPEHIQNAIGLFRGRTGQYVFISSASVYQKPPHSMPVTEQTPAENPFWGYAQLKIACENVLHGAQDFPWTIVRPSHTYNQTKIPMIGGFTAFNRLRTGRPVVLHGDGTSIWTLTHSSDFAPGLVGLLGQKEALGEIYHITSNEWLSWNEIYRLFGNALGVEPTLVHVPSAVIAQHDKEIGDGLFGDKMHSMLFDNTKIRSLVPDFDPKIRFAEGVKDIVNWYSTAEHGFQEDEGINRWMDLLTQKQ